MIVVRYYEEKYFSVSKNYYRFRIRNETPFAYFYEWGQVQLNIPFPVLFPKNLLFYLASKAFIAYNHHITFKVKYTYIKRRSHE